MSAICFARPGNGAVRDVKELEYVAALHQAVVNDLGTVSTECIRLRLLSRFGIIHVQSTAALQRMVQELGGNVNTTTTTTTSVTPSSSSCCNDAPYFFLDIPQLVALLILPQLKRDANINDNNDSDNNDNGSLRRQDAVFGQFISILKQDLGVPADQPLHLTKHCLRNIWTIYGETDICDVALESMIEHAIMSDNAPNNNVDKDQDESSTCQKQQQRQPTTIELTQEVLMQALTKDLQAFDTTWADSKTTIWQDFGTVVKGGVEAAFVSDKNAAENKVVEQQGPPADDNEVQAMEQQDNHDDHHGLFLTQNLNSEHIDLVSDTFRSSPYFVLLFCCCIFCYLAYKPPANTTNQAECQVVGDFLCECAHAIAQWLVLLLQLGVGGCIFIFLASLGNAMEHNCPFWARTLALGIVGAANFVPFWVDQFPKALIRTDSEYVRWAPYLCLVTGGAIAVTQIGLLLRHWIPWCQHKLIANSVNVWKEFHSKKAGKYKAKGLIDHALALHQEGASRSSSSSSSSSNGSNLGEENTTDNDKKDEALYSSQNRALLNFQLKKNERETVGGFWWTWRALYNEHICSQEGIWMGTRLEAAMVGQVLALFTFLFVYGWLLGYIQNEYDPTEVSSSTTTVVLAIPGGPRSVYFNTTGSYLLTQQEATKSYLEDNHLTFAYAFDTDLEMYQESLNTKALQSLLSVFESNSGVAASVGYASTNILLNDFTSRWKEFTGFELEHVIEYAQLYASFEGGFTAFVYEEAKKIITAQDLRASLLFGGFCGIIAMFAILLTFIPSAVTQTLRYRSGVNGYPLVDPTFRSLKKDPWLVALVFGEAFWGIVCTGVIVTCICGSVLFVFLWSETTDFAIKSLATAIAIIISWLLKTTILWFARSKLYDGLFRKRPFMANLLHLLMETWHLSLAFGFVVARAIKNILMACAYVGRLDIHFVNPQVTLFGFTIDDDWRAFHADILLHEAHRHPYLEALSLVYLIKLYKGRDFATRDGCSWRLLYVLALMPWLRRYRVHTMRQCQTEPKTVKSVGETAPARADTLGTTDERD